jgi:AraC family L-rhamnose operon regulatory protein RhaS
MRYNRPKYLYELFEGGESLLPEAPRVGWVNFFYPKPAGLGHPHRRRWVHEVYYVVGGVLRLTIQDRIVETTVGETLIVSPGMTHSGIMPLNIIEPCELCWFELNLSQLKRCADVSSSERRDVVSSIQALQLETFAIAPETQSRFRQLVNEHRGKGSVFSARHVLLSLLHNLLRDHRAAMESNARRRRTQNAAIRSALETISSGGARTSTAVLARSVKLPLPEFYRRFRAETGATPLAYRLRMKMRIAQKLVGEGALPISQIATRLGFSSSQYFATVFKRMTDFTPREYRRQCSPPAKP